MRVQTKIKRHGILVSASGNVLTVEFLKPDCVTLILEHKDGTKRRDLLTGDKVPDLEDWEELADTLWMKFQHRGHNPVIRIWMEDSFGALYLRRLSYGE